MKIINMKQIRVISIHHLAVTVVGCMPTKSGRVHPRGKLQFGIFQKPAIFLVFCWSQSCAKQQTLMSGKPLRVVYGWDCHVAFQTLWWETNDSPKSQTYLVPISAHLKLWTHPNSTSQVIWNHENMALENDSYDFQWVYDRITQGSVLWCLLTEYQLPKIKLRIASSSCSLD